MLKGYILFGDPDYLEMFNDSYNAIKKYIKHKYGLYFNVYMDNGHYHSTNMDGYKKKKKKKKKLNGFCNL